jgi:hypothetical protein
MNGSPASRYTAEEELNLGSPPSHSLFATSSSNNNNDDDSFDSDDDEYVNGDDAYPEYGETSSSPQLKSNNRNKKNKRITELWKDDIRGIKTRKGRIGSITTGGGGGGGQSFEMVPLSDKDDDHELGEFDYDNEEEDDDVHERRRQKRQSTSQQLATTSGDDYTISNTYLPKNIYQYIYPPNVPREVQLMRPENIAVPACYLLVGLLQGLSGPFTNVYPLDLNASEAQQVSKKKKRLR